MSDVLDHGYVHVVNTMGSDLDVVNAARASFEKEVTQIDSRDQKLISFLVKHKHDSVLRHCAMTFEVYAPLMVARQWYKHAVGSAHLDDQMGWNESSRRYVSENEVFYIPGVNQWRSIPENRKQGSGEPVEDLIGAKYTKQMEKLVKQSHDLYLEAMADGIAPEQARLLLPAYSMYVRWRWTASLNALLHFISLRQSNDSQSEIQLYADAVFAEVQKAFPVTATEWLAHRV